MVDDNEHTSPNLVSIHLKHFLELLILSISRTARSYADTHFSGNGFDYKINID